MPIAIRFIRETQTSKLALWGIMLAMGLGVLLYNEIPLLSPSDPNHPHLYQIHWVLLPHIVCGVIAMLAGPLQFSTRLRKQHPQLYRMLGKVYVTSVVIGASLAAYLDLTADLQPGLMVNIGFLSHPFAWGLTAVIAYRTAVTRNFHVHRQWMIRSYLITFTFVLVRLPMPIRAWREMSPTSGSIVLATLMFLCFFGADIALNWREITVNLSS